MPHTCKLVIPGMGARRATWIGEKEESASHHLFIIMCFAQLRAEMAENDARRRQETSRNAENLNFRTIKNITFFLRAQAFRCKD